MEATITTHVTALRSGPAWPAATLLGRLRPELRDQLLALGARRQYPRSHPLLRQGECADNAVLLVRGTAKVVTSPEDGRLALLGVARAGDLVAEMPALYGMRGAANVITCGRVTVHEIPASAFREFLRCQPEAHLAVTQLVADRLRESNRRRADYVLSVPCRLARVLVELAETIGSQDPGGRYELPDCLTQAELGSLAGMARRTVEEQLRDLQHNGTVDLAYRRMTINDMPGLYAMAKLTREPEPPVEPWRTD